MISELANLALALAIGLSLMLVICPLIGVARQNERLMKLCRPLVYCLFIVILLAFLALVYLLVVNDFSVSYVALNSNIELPIYYRIAAAWGAHEGSLLLWLLLLAAWTLAVACFSDQIPTDAIARVLAVMGMVNLGFLIFIVFTSNPFDRTLPYVPLEGRELNPLLQDVGLIFHPPLLYMGYVGFSVVFAFAIASLMAGRLDTAWARWSRPWTLAAWVFLTLGIVLGSFWAYYELGWGGWWFWDPVENASFMPWITGTALIHSLVVTEKRGTFKAWTVLLAIASFSLCLLGTFLVRSGILVSVHSFSSDPMRGLYLLFYLLVVVGGSFLLYAIKGAQVNKNDVQHNFFSRETCLLANNLILVTAMLVVLLGTLLPLVHKQLGLGSISIGEPFFNQLFVWLMAPFSLLLGIGPLIRWRRDKLSTLVKPLLIAFIFTLAGAVVLPWLLQDKIIGMAVAGLMMAFWVVLLMLMELYRRSGYQNTIWQGLARLSPSHWGMAIAHLGLAVTVIGIAFSQNYSVERDVRMKVGNEPINIHNYTATLRHIDLVKGVNYVSDKATIEITRKGQLVTELHPEKRYYKASSMMMTEAAIDGGVTRDLYAALGERLDNDSWAIRLYYKPFIRWIWVGGIFMALGGIFCLFDPRYRLPSWKKENTE